MAVSIVGSVTSLISLLDCLENLPTQPPSLYLDIEGVRLSRHGSISIIQLLVFPLNLVFLIDIHVLQNSAFSAPNLPGSTLKSVLESESVPKIFFDVRNDADALFAHFQISMQGIQDLQLLEVASRPCSKDRVSGLASCIENDVPLPAEAKEAWRTTKESGKELFDRERGGSYEVFNVRPLRQDIIEYCTNDVVYLPLLWDIYSRKISSGWAVKVEEETRKRLLASQAVSYKPHGKAKTLSPWARPLKAGKSKHFNNRAKDDPKLLEPKLQGLPESVVAKPAPRKQKKQPAASLVHQSPIEHNHSQRSSGEASLNSTIQALYANKSSENPTSQSILATSSEPVSGQNVPTAPDSLLPPTALPSTWICSTCDRMMQVDQKQDHLVGKSHTSRLKQLPNVASTSSELTTNASDINNTMERAPVLHNLAFRSRLTSSQEAPVLPGTSPDSAAPPSSWTCTTCSRSMNENHKQAHLVGQKNIARLKRAQAASASPVQSNTTVSANNSPQIAAVAKKSSRSARKKQAQTAILGLPVQTTTAASRNPLQQVAPSTTTNSTGKVKPEYKSSTKSSHPTASSSRELGQPYPDWGFVGFAGGSYGTPESFEYEDGAGDYSICDKDCGWCGRCMDGVGVYWDD